MPKSEITIKIDNQTILAEKGQTVLQIARDHKIEIPALCDHPDLEIKANCRLCLVEIEGQPGLHTSCNLPAEDGMVIRTESEAIEKARRTNLELLFAQHREECNDCVWQTQNCQLLKLARQMKINMNRYHDRKTNLPTYKFGPALLFDSSKCVDCRNCVEVCQKQGVGYLEVREKGHLFQIVPTENPNIDCIYCGQCLTHCPVGAFEGIGEFEDIEKPLQEPDKVVVFQIAPSIRSSLGEEFNLPGGAIVTEKISAGLKLLGADRVFDVSLGADITTMEEAKELIQRIKENKPLPMFTSCCPAWVRFVELFYPEFIPHLTTVRSPQIILGGIIKNYWSVQERLSPEDITVVSIMPCVAKKYEITRQEMFHEGIPSVDYVLTTRELARLFKKHRIDLANIPPQKLDNPLGMVSGAGVIFGASGGVMESALRTACHLLGEECLPRLEYENVRGLDEVKRTTVSLGGQVLKLAVINGTGNAKKILEELKKQPKLFDYIEVMACPGGCIGGGGQPVPTSPTIREKRAKGLYQIDQIKDIRTAHDNPMVKKIYTKFLDNQETIHQICHTKFTAKKRGD